MRPLVAFALACLAYAANPAPSRAEHAKINLDVSGSGEQVTAFVDQTPPEHGKNPRPVLKVKAGQTVKIQWSLTNVYCALSGLLLSPPMVEHAKINLDVTVGTEQVTAFVDQTPPDHGKNPRPVIKAKEGEEVKIVAMFTNTYPNKTIENVVIHFYVARQDKVGQKATPDLTVEENVILETAMEMDFKPGAKAGSRTKLHAPKPGVYLIRIESRQTNSDHEHFAAVDLVVEGKKQ
jgi:hypothetical protein